MPSIPGGPQRRYPLLAASAADSPSVSTLEKWVCPSMPRGPESGQAGQAPWSLRLGLEYVTSPFWATHGPHMEWDGAPASWGCLEVQCSIRHLARAWHRTELLRNWKLPYSIEHPLNSSLHPAFNFCVWL